MAYFLRRAVHMLVVLWAIASILFFLFRLMPGDPTIAQLDPTFTEEQRQHVMAQFGLDKPLSEQYVIYMWNLARGEFGLSFRQRQPVVGLVLAVLPNTMLLTLGALIVAYVFGAIFGAFLAWHRGSWFERISVPIVLTTRAAPEFWLGMLVLSVFAFGLNWFPSGGANIAGARYSSEWNRIFSLDYLRHLVLPVLTLAIYLQGLPVLLMRSNMLEVMREEFVTMARMKGLPERTIILRHAARNALLPLVTAFALGFGQSVGGNVVIESVFSWPGLGRMLVDAVASSDYPLAQGAFLAIATVLVVMNFVADLLYSWLDPRVGG
ncbi:ABC transporter permease [Bosea sp. SSUT16]|jgi:peptide/nickel transport system permease protein|uniref:ABC transporter permease n=1 Tax=Bosea spartocytisi TaxID=2773451 RepID=A0A927E6D3_9HYPH|nr:ABC transporter permease [Bosea spartocytisi]MBD3844470.1 ABC transporter permease [Bosea spartocytisi]MCT4470424.1 ABC transporter permease [Bosea spartocytisi]